MAESTDRVRALTEQITAVTDTHKNVTGLVEKLAKIQAALTDAGFDGISDKVSEPFSGLSTAADGLQALLHEMENERNTIAS